MRKVPSISGYVHLLAFPNVRHLGYNEFHLSLIKCHCRSFMMSLTFISTIYELFHHFLSIVFRLFEFPPNIYITAHSLSCFCAAFPIKTGGIKLVLWDQTSLFSETSRSNKETIEAIYSPICYKHWKHKI
jgi:hypothetical protein